MSLHHFICRHPVLLAPCTSAFRRRCSPTSPPNVAGHQLLADVAGIFTDVAIGQSDAAGKLFHTVLKFVEGFEGNVFLCVIGGQELHTMIVIWMLLCQRYINFVAHFRGLFGSTLAL